MRAIDIAQTVLPDGDDGDVAALALDIQERFDSGYNIKRCFEWARGTVSALADKSEERSMGTAAIIELPEEWANHFPKNETGARAWKPLYFKHVLAFNILVVAKTKIEGKWNAYINIVPGQDHDKEMHESWRGGTKLNEDIARLLFPQFEGVPYAG